MTKFSPEEKPVTEIDHTSPIPLYYQLKLLIQKQIENGSLAPGQRIPTEAELCQRFHISRTPVRQALLELVREGMLTRVAGRGTFVTPVERKTLLLQVIVPVGYGHLQDVRSRARAQDNQFFVVAANHVGDEGGVVYCGRSQVADPRGEVLAIGSDDAAEVIVAEVDLALIREQRLQEPVFRGFRPSLYVFSQ